MDEVARKKLDGQKHLYRHLSDTESRVVDGTEGTIKRILYDAGYPVQDHRELETGSDLSGSSCTSDLQQIAVAELVADV